MLSSQTYSQRWTLKCNQQLIEISRYTTNIVRSPVREGQRPQRRAIKSPTNRGGGYHLGAASPSLTVLLFYYHHPRAFESSRQEFPCSALPQQGKSSQAPGPDRLEKGRLQPHPQPHTHGSQSNGKTHREMVCLPRNVQTTDKMGTRVPQVPTTNGASSPEFRTSRSQRNTAQ